MGELSGVQCFPPSVLRSTVPAFPTIQQTLSEVAEPVVRSVATGLCCDSQVFPPSVVSSILPAAPTRQARFLPATMIKPRWLATDLANKERVRADTSASVEVLLSLDTAPDTSTVSVPLCRKSFLSALSGRLLAPAPPKAAVAVGDGGGADGICLTAKASAETSGDVGVRAVFAALNSWGPFSSEGFTLSACRDRYAKSGGVMARPASCPMAGATGLALGRATSDFDANFGVEDGEDGSERSSCAGVVLKGAEDGGVCWRFWATSIVACFGTDSVSCKPTQISRPAAKAPNGAIQYQDLRCTGTFAGGGVAAAMAGRVES